MALYYFDKYICPKCHEKFGMIVGLLYARRHKRLFNIMIATYELDIAMHEADHATEVFLEKYKTKAG